MVASVPLSALVIVVLFKIGGGTCQTAGSIVPSVNVADLIYYLYPSATQKIPITTSNASLSAAGFVAGAPTFFVVDGFLTTSNSSMSLNMMNALVSLPSPKNVIVLDWGALNGGNTLIDRISAPAASTMYSIVVLNVVPVGQDVARFMSFLQNNSWATSDKFTIIGHSLGAHIAGAAGYSFKQTTGAAIYRATGLDPAGPLYQLSFLPGIIIKKGYATFVDLYHSDKSELGSDSTRLGDIDVYINGGGGPISRQPGCPIIDTYQPGFCSHEYSWKFFTATISGSVYSGCSCSTTPYISLSGVGTNCYST